MKKIFFLLLFSLILISSASALESLGEFDVNQCVTISQTCATCTFVNISSINLPNSTSSVNNVSMNSVGNGEWNFIFCNTSVKGRYDVRGQGDINGNNTSFTTFFNIGKASSTGESILYFLFVVIMFGFLLGLFFLISVLPSDNEQDERGEFIGVVKLKYIRAALIAITYPLIIIILNLMNGLAVQFSSLSIFAGIIGFIFEIMIKVAWVFTLIWIIWIFYMLVKDSNVQRGIDSLGRFRVNG